MRAINTSMPRPSDIKPSHSLRLLSELRAKLATYMFTHFITLASNFESLTYPRMRSLLREWDARVNRELNGPKWLKRPDERVLWFAFPEKLDVNPHWHLIAEIDPAIDTASRRARADRFAAIAENQWTKLLPRGSFDCQDVDSERVIDYVTKVAAGETNFEKFSLCGLDTINSH